MWVLGSATHYTLLFGFEKLIVSAAEERRSEAISKFSSYCLDEGLAMGESLGQILQALQLDPNDPDAAKLVNEGVVILDDFLRYLESKKVIQRKESAEPSLDLFFVNAQFPVEVCQVKVQKSTGNEDISDTNINTGLHSILRTRWPTSRIEVRNPD